jgi:sugar lactone lactonase YvrE
LEAVTMRTQFLVIAVASAVFAGCAAEPEPPAPEPEASAPTPDVLPATIVAERGGFVPEGVEYDAANGRILTGSLVEGSVLQIHSDGRVTTVVTDPELVSSVGIEADEPGNRLLVVNSDRSVFGGETAGQAKLGVYNLATGARLAMVDLAAADVGASSDAAYFANDVAVGEDGTAYVTDTRMGMIYQVEANPPDIS